MSMAYECHSKKKKNKLKNNNYKKKRKACSLDVPYTRMHFDSQVLDPIWRTLGLETAIGKMTMI